MNEELKQNNFEDNFSKSCVTVCIFGYTGTGKSTLANELMSNTQKTGNHRFIQGTGVHSCTKKIDIQDGQWFDNQGMLRIVDVQGLGDSEGNDQKFLDDQLEEIKKLVTVQLFCFVFQYGRISGPHWQMLTLYESLLGGKSCWEHVVCVITHVDYNPLNYESLEEYEQELQKVENEFKEAFRSRFKTDMAGVYALSLFTSKKGTRDDNQKKALTKQLHKIRNHLTYYNCSSMQRAYTKDLLLQLISSYQNRSDLFEDEVKEFLEGEQIKNKILELLKNINANDKENRILKEKYLKILLEKTQEPLNEYIQQNLNELMQRHLYNFKKEVKDWVEMAAEQLKSFNILQKEQSKFQDDILDIIGEILKDFIRVGVAAIKLQYLDAKNSVMNLFSMHNDKLREDIIEEANNLQLEYLKNNQLQTQQIMRQRWKDSTKKAWEIIEERKKILDMEDKQESNSSIYSNKQSGHGSQ